MNMNIKIYVSGTPRLCIVLHEGEESSTIVCLDKSISITGKLQLSKPYTTDNKYLLSADGLDEFRDRITKKYTDKIETLKQMLVS